MKKKLVLLITVIILSVLLFGCGTEQESKEDVLQSNYPMFVEIESNNYYSVVYHKNTKVMYAVSMGAYNRGSFEVLLNADGTPMLYESM